MRARSSKIGRIAWKRRDECISLFLVADKKAGRIATRQAIFYDPQAIVAEVPEKLERGRA
jgi:hypothetical protein